MLNAELVVYRTLDRCPVSRGRMRGETVNIEDKQQRVHSSSAPPVVSPCDFVVFCSPTFFLVMLIDLQDLIDLIDSLTDMSRSGL